MKRTEWPRFVVVACAAVAITAHSALAQKLDRSRRPVAPPDRALEFPTTFSQTLADGLRVIVIENHALPLVAVRAVVGVDSLSDPPGKEGLFALTSAMLREGAAGMTADQQSSAIAALGSNVGPFTFTTITQNFKRSLDLMAGMLVHPALPSEALGRQKSVLMAAEHRRRQIAGTALYVVFYRRLLGDSDPTARTFVASDASISSITLEELRTYHDTYFRPANTTVIIVGDVQHAAALGEVQKAFAGWRAGPKIPKTPARTAGPRSPTTIYLLDRPGAAQSVAIVGTTGPSRGSRDFAALEVMAPVLGTTPASRLLQNLRARHSYTYGGVPGLVTWRPPPAPSIIGGAATISATKTDSALIEWLKELRDIRERPATEQELTLARGALRGLLALRLETDDAIANRVVDLVQNGLPLDFYNGYVARIDKVSATDIGAAATKYIDPNRLVIVVSGDRKVIEPALRSANIAPIMIVDGAGEPIG